MLQYLTPSLLKMLIAMHGPSVSLMSPSQFGTVAIRHASTGEKYSNVEFVVIAAVTKTT
jgi:hypothetical protein